MLSIIFAKPHCADPHQLVGQSIDAHSHIKAIKVYNDTAHHTLFAALVDAPKPVKAQISHALFESFAVHSVKLRQGSSKASFLRQDIASHGSQQKRHRKRRRQKEKMTSLSEQTWTRFIKRKHLLKAYRATDSNFHHLPQR